MPMLIKKTAMKTSFIGPTFSITSLARMACDTMRPIMNAPMAIDRPIRLERRAMAKHRPSEMIRRTSGSYFLPIQLSKRGMTLLPRTRLAPMNITMLMTIKAMEPSAGVSPTSNGAAMVSIMT
ncbi:MAG TPA: hypothetical protein PLF76_00320 [Methanomassiliicoccaceae archaeon]|nr:hypothetical protein [Methanomassiliicoccaceae archaeon]